MKLSNIFILLLLATTLLFAQKSKGEWVPVTVDGQDKVFIDVAGIENFAGEDIYVWTLTEHSIPIVIESIKDKIYKTNTYYLFNVKLNKYSILHIIYYDKSGNVLASYDYDRSTKVESYQYNYPIFENSLEEKILDKCISTMNKRRIK